MKHNLKLKVDYDLNFILFGIRSEIKDYQFAYFLNKSSFFRFQRMLKDISYILNNKKLYFSAFEDMHNDEQKSCFLIRNKSCYQEEFNDKKSLFDESVEKTALLIPELKEFDYLIKLVGIWKKKELLTLTECLHQIKNAEPHTSINLKKIKSINNLVF